MDAISQTTYMFMYIFLNENIWIAIEISPKFIPKGSVNNISALIQIMAWRRPGDKPLSEPMMVNFLAHICVVQPQWFNVKPFTDSPYQGGKTCKIIYKKRNAR